MQFIFLIYYLLLIFTFRDKTDLVDMCYISIIIYIKSYKTCTQLLTQSFQVFIFRTKVSIWKSSRILRINIKYTILLISHCFRDFYAFDFKEFRMIFHKFIVCKS